MPGAYLGIVDLLIGDDHLGLRGAAAGLGAVALRGDDLAAGRHGGVGKQGGRQDDALAARAREADLVADLVGQQRVRRAQPRERSGRAARRRIGRRVLLALGVVQHADR